jgi:hypothetical protein
MWEELIDYERVRWSHMQVSAGSVRWPVARLDSEKSKGQKVWGDREEVHLWTKKTK